MKELKVGDRVAIYDDAIRSTGEVLSINQIDGNILVRGRWYHHKQLRLLTKRKAREWDVYVTDEGCLCISPLSQECSNKPIRIREILERGKK